MSLFGVYCFGGIPWIGAREPYQLLKDRSDVLAFETGPMSDDTEVTGEVTVKLWVSSTAVDTDFTVKLIDVYGANEDYPEGKLTLTLWPTSNVFKKGHRLRVDISSSNFPRFDVNPNTGEPVGKHTKIGVPPISWTPEYA